jgi:hypothetical protein
VSTQVGRARYRRVLTVTAALATASACSLATVRSTATTPVTREQIAQLWVEPESIAARDLFWGPGGADRVPKPNDVYRVTRIDVTGYSRGYDVVATDGRAWRIKLGLEAHSEFVASRLLWAIGFHQPTIYTVDKWTLQTGGGGAIARFRL